MPLELLTINSGREAALDDFDTMIASQTGDGIAFSAMDPGTALHDRL